MRFLATEKFFARQRTRDELNEIGDWVLDEKIGEDKPNQTFWTWILERVTMHEEAHEDSHKS